MTAARADARSTHLGSAVTFRVNRPGALMLAWSILTGFPLTIFLWVAAEDVLRGGSLANGHSRAGLFLTFAAVLFVFGPSWLVIHLVRRVKWVRVVPETGLLFNNGRTIPWSDLAVASRSGRSLTIHTKHGEPALLSNVEDASRLAALVDRYRGG